MVRLENKTIEKIVKEGRVSHIPINESQNIVLKTRERMKSYIIKLKKRTYASHVSAGRLIYNA